MCYEEGSFGGLLRTFRKNFLRVLGWDFNVGIWDGAPESLCDCHQGGKGGRVALHLLLRGAKGAIGFLLRLIMGWPFL